MSQSKQAFLKKRLTKNVSCNLNDDCHWGNFIEIKTLEDEDHLNGTPTTGKNDHNDDHLEQLWKARHLLSIFFLSYHSGDFLLRTKTLTVISPRNAVHPKAFKHKQIQLYNDENRKDERKEEENHLVHGLIVLVHQEGANWVLIIVGNIVR